MPQLRGYAISATATLRLVLPSSNHAITPSASYYSIGPTGEITTGTIQPGDVVVFSAGTHAGPRIANFISPTEAAPIMFTNDGSLLRGSAQWRNAEAALGGEPGPVGWPAAGGTVTFSGSSVKSDKMVSIVNSRHIHFDGRGDAGTEYGFDIVGGGRLGGYYAEQTVTNIWFWHCAVEGTWEGFSVKNEPTSTLNRDLPNAFIQRDTQVIHCWVRNTMGREGTYLGYTSFYRNTAPGSTGYKPIEVIGIIVRDCVIENTGFDGIQATGADVDISWNYVWNSATLATAGQEAAIIANPSRGPQTIHHNTIVQTRRGIEYQANEGSIHHNTFVGCEGGYMLFIKLVVAADGFDQYIPPEEIDGKHLAVFDNTGNGGGTWPVWIIRDRGTCELKNNLFIPYVTPCFVLSDGAAAVTTLHVAPDPDADYVTMNTAEPQFWEWWWDLRLTAGSPSIGKGAHPIADLWWEGDGDPPPVTYVLTTNVTGGGTVAKNPNMATYAFGSSVELTASPAAGYSFAGWSGDAGGIDNPLTVIMDAAKSVTATFTPIPYAFDVTTVGSGTVAKSPDATTYVYGDVVQLAASPAEGWHLDGWSGDASGTENPLTVTVDADKAVTATFAENPTIRFTLDVTTTGNGTVTKSPDAETYGYGDVVQLAANPATGWHFAGWTGDASGSTNPLTLTVTANANIAATFVQDAYSLVVAIAGGGTVARNPDGATYLSGSSVELTASPAAGYSFAGWSGDAGGTDNPLTVTMDAAKSVTATFTPIPYALTVAVAGSGTVEKSPDRSAYIYGDVVQLTATPASGYAFSGWSGDASGTTNPLTITVSANTSITATFLQIVTTVLYRIDSGGGASTTGGVAWSADAMYTGSTSTFSNTRVTNIAGTTDDPLYRTIRQASASGGSFGYNIPMPNGTGYTVRLHFAEVYWKTPRGGTGGGGAGSRVFTVSIEGTPVLANYDVIADVGAATAVVKQFANISVGDGSLTIAFASVKDRAMISAIEVLQTTFATPPARIARGNSRVAAVADLALVDRATGADIHALVDGDTLNLADLPARAFDLRASVSAGAIGSIEIAVDGVRLGIQDTAPYPFAGERTWTPRPGTYELVATAFDGPGATGESGAAFRATITVIDVGRIDALSPSYPNPFNPATTIPWALARAGHVRLAVFDALGQEVRTLVDENRPAGNTVAIWDGMDGAGRQAASGAYFVRLVTDRGVLVRRIVLVR